VNAKKGVINASCKACGHNYILDMRHKLTTFILKVRNGLIITTTLTKAWAKCFQNPPDQDLKASGTSLTERKEKRSKRREQEQQVCTFSSTKLLKNCLSLLRCIFKDENTADSKTGNGNTNFDDDYDDDDWTTDVSKEAVKQRMKVYLIF